MPNRPPWATREAYDILQRSERELEPLIEEIDRLETCGVECQQYRDMCAAMLAQSRAIRAAFFDPPPV